MKKLVLLVVGLLSLTLTRAQNWTLDKAHSRLGFGITHLMISEVNGNFKTFDVKLTSSKDDFTDAAIEVTADINTINTELEMRDNDLRSEKWFNAATYPTLIFKSTSFKKVADKKYVLVGDLTIKGVTKSVSLDVTLIGTMTRERDKKLLAGFKITGTFKRTDFGIGSTPASVSEEVNLISNLELVKN
jgi:polyisoprenoid-binding protein YceI